MLRQVYAEEEKYLPPARRGVRPPRCDAALIVLIVLIVTIKNY